MVYACVSTKEITTWQSSTKGIGIVQLWWYRDVVVIDVTSLLARLFFFFSVMSTGCGIRWFWLWPRYRFLRCVSTRLGLTYLLEMQGPAGFVQCARPFNVWGCQLIDSVRLVRRDEIDEIGNVRRRNRHVKQVRPMRTAVWCIEMSIDR